MKKIAIISAVAGIFALLVGLFAYSWWNGVVKAPSEDSANRRIVISKGASAEEIGKILEKEGVIKSAFAFKLYTQINNLTQDIPPGQFNIAANLTLEDVVLKLLKGPSEVWVTIPEGFRREQVAERVANGLGLVGVERDNFLSEFLTLTKNKEGYLFPDTYLFPPDVSASRVLSTLLSTFDKKFPQGERDKLDPLGISLDEAVVLASIIERETLNASERPEVAGVLYNRLEADWPLQVDASLQYITGGKRCLGKTECDWWTPPTVEEKNIPSPYNTYLNSGLPPAPIANPGRTALLAVANPISTNYWFYIHDDSGSIHFARDLSEHNANISKYLR
ncbi:endolytic transglycosylase MltG [Candidatus Microgenomates bacterium]|nr:MAG: endolytic transglycosylase MltG [Candidatus Microgenomates bacterium]